MVSSLRLQRRHRRPKVQVAFRSGDEARPVPLWCFRFTKRANGLEAARSQGGKTSGGKGILMLLRFWLPVPESHLLALRLSSTVMKPSKYEITEVKAFAVRVAHVSGPVKVLGSQRQGRACSCSISPSRAKASYRIFVSYRILYRILVPCRRGLPYVTEDRGAKITMFGLAGI